MSLFAVTSAKGSPGATTVALGLARELARQAAGDAGTRPCLVDADPDGGDLGLLLGLDPVPGVGTLALAGRHGLDAPTLFDHAQSSRLLPSVAVVPGVSGRAQASSLEWLGAPLAEVASSPGLRVVADVGRAFAFGDHNPLLARADTVLVTCRGDTSSIVHARSTLLALRNEGARVAAVLTGKAKERPEELAAVLGSPVAGMLWPGESQSSLLHPTRAALASFERLAGVLLGKSEPLAVPAVVPLEGAPGSAVAAAMSLGRTGAAS